MSPEQNQTKFTSKLKNKKVLVLGGTSGIGFAVAEGALEYGAEVVISSSNPQKLEKAMERLRSAYPTLVSKISGTTCDLAQPETLEANLKTLFEFAGNPIHHIAFTAGDAIKITPLSDATVDYIQKAGFVRFVAPIMLAKIATAYLAPGPESSITLTSGTVSAKPNPGYAILAGWGAGIEGLTRGLAVDLKPVRVNCVALGAVHTEFYNNYFTSDRLDAVLEGIGKKTLTGEVGQPTEVAEAYLYAMKDRFVTGTLLSSDGGGLLA